MYVRAIERCLKVKIYRLGLKVFQSVCYVCEGYERTCVRARQREREVGCLRVKI